MDPSGMAPAASGAGGSEVQITPAALVGLICAAGGLEVIPARAWPVEAAIEVLQQRAPADGPVRRAADRWPGRRPAGPGLRGVRASLRQLAAVGWVAPDGSGWRAGWRIATAWSEFHLGLLAGLQPADRAAVQSAGQLAAEMSSSWSKNEVAAAPTS